MWIRAQICHPSPSELHEISWSLLYDMIQEQFEIAPNDLIIARTETGKPYFPSHPEIQFSIAHSVDAAVCVLASQPIGVDIEKIRPISPRIKTHILQLPEGADDRLSLCRWTMMESYVKYCGERMGKKTFHKTEKTAALNCRFEDYSELLGEEYVITVCLPKE